MVSKKATPKKVTAKTAGAKTTKHAKKAASGRVDYYPNRMTLVISAAAGSLLVLFAIMGVYFSK